VNFVVGQGDEKVESSMVTASTSLNLRAFVGEPGPRAVLLQVAGTLAEHDDGALVVTYSIGAKFPEEKSGSQQEETASGTLIARLGVSYPVFSSGKRTYWLTFLPYTDEKSQN
jgi:hypothetical protein